MDSSAIVSIPHKDVEAGLRIMLHSVGISVYGAKRAALQQLNRVARFKFGGGFVPKKVDSLSDVQIIVTVKHYDIEPLRKAFPRHKILWFNINRANPGHVPGKDVWKTNPCIPSAPCLTASKRYAGQRNYFAYFPIAGDWPIRNVNDITAGPISLVHSVNKLGYGFVFESAARRFNIRFFGNNSPQGILPHGKIHGQLSRARCYVNLKDSDCPGYSLYQAMLTGCPVIMSSQFIHTTGYDDLYENGQTCLFFDDPITDDLSIRRRAIIDSLAVAIKRLECDRENKRIGEKARSRLIDLMWNKTHDADSLRCYLQRWGIIE